MIRNSIRSYSSKSVPFFDHIPNKFNAARSTYNLRPQIPQGLIHNPPASIASAKATPKAFLPPSDPRSKLVHHKTYTTEVVQDMPIIFSTKAQKTYDITPETVQEIQTLRASNPKEWTVNKLAKKFNVTPAFVKVTTQIESSRKDELSREFQAETESWPVEKQRARVDRRRRAELWLRNEF